MRAEFYRPDQPDRVVGMAVWDGRKATTESPDDEARRALARIFRKAPVVVDDPALLPQGARGQVVLEPGSLSWFRAAAQNRAAEVGLFARIVPEVEGGGGWDPAAAYRTFRESVEQLVAGAPENQT
jgi:hypothetical protein